MSKGHRQEYSSRWRRKLTASATGTLIERRKSDSLSSSIFCCVSFYLCLKKWFWKLRSICQKKIAARELNFNSLQTLSYDDGPAGDVLGLWCDRGRVFSQHGCSFNKLYCQTLPRLLFFSVLEQVEWRSDVFTLFLIQTCVSVCIQCMHVCWKWTECRFESLFVLCYNLLHNNGWNRDNYKMRPYQRFTQNKQYLLLNKKK